MDSQQISTILPILVQQAKEGNTDAFRNLFDHLNTRLFAYAYSHTSNKEDAMDIVQETFIELWDGLRKFRYRSEEAFYGFVFLILKRKLFRHYRTRKPTVPLEEDALSNSYTMEHEDYRYLLQHINSLSWQHQELLRLRYWAGMSFLEIAAILNIKETTAKVRHMRALEKLKLRLAPAIDFSQQ